MPSSSSFYAVGIQVGKCIESTNNWKIDNVYILYRWLQHVSITVNAGTDDACNVSWSVFHASHTDTTVTGSQIMTSSLLPLFPEDAATVAMIKHSLDILKKITELVNPGQAPVVAIDQLLFAIAKRIQWKWPLLYR